MTPDPWYAAWVFDAPALLLLGGTSALYLRGRGRRHARGAPAQPRRTAAFLAGVAAGLLALVTPIAAWSAHLFWVHMVQHLLLLVVAAPLLALGEPVSTIRPVLPPAGRHALARASRWSRRLRRGIGDPHPVLLATVVHILATWIWHAPVLYDAAVSNAGIHLLEHAAFLGTGVWFWSEIVAVARRDRRSRGLAPLCLGALIATGGVLGALLVFADRSLYAVYTGAGGLTALEDQEFAGALMWVPPSFVYAVVAIRLFVAWIDASDTELRARERRERAAGRH
ncbi:cytochrome c oxidase assembly protein [Egicoccus sp. AB-alg2]|uniref:cytochrome c oxidase assembly protein n=1 Tax=Egicoccus sp. AB-alg2 TaxID=3242693 RepID=UPI00359E204A